MREGDIIRWETPSGESKEGRIVRVPSAMGPMAPGGASLMVVRDADGVVHQFDAWLTAWQIVQDDPGNN